MLYKTHFLINYFYLTYMKRSMMKEKLKKAKTNTPQNMESLALELHRTLFVGQYTQPTFIL